MVSHVGLAEHYCRTKLFCELIILAIEPLSNIVNAHLFSIYLYITKTEPRMQNCKIENSLLCAKTQILSTHKNSVLQYMEDEVTMREKDAVAIVSILRAA